MKQGKFIVLEGGEGVGKTTQTDILLEKLNEKGHKAEFIREPGGDPLAEKIRELVLDNALERIPETEVLLFNAARTQTLAKVRRHVDKGNWVISDRSWLSTIAMQGYGRGMNLDDVRVICEFATKTIKPDLIMLLDASLEATASRRSKRGVTDHFEELGDDFHQRARKGYLAEAERLKIPVLDASLSVGEVSDLIWQNVEPLLN